MKKFFLVAAIMTATVSLAKAEQYQIPEANTGQGVFSADYGGMKYSTGVFTVNHVTAAITGPIVFSSVFFSSGNAQNYDFVDVWDASAAIATPSAPLFRVYNYNSSTTTSSGSNGPRFPIRLSKGLIWRASSSAYNSIVVQFWKQQNGPNQ